MSVSARTRAPCTAASVLHRAAATCLPDNHTAAPESAAAAAAIPVGTPGNVPVDANDGVDEALCGRRPVRRS